MTSTRENIILRRILIGYSIVAVAVIIAFAAILPPGPQKTDFMAYIIIATVFAGLMLIFIAKKQTQSTKLKETNAGQT